MGRFITITGIKLGNMRKADDFLVTPSKEITNGIVSMQGEKRALRMDLNTKKGVLSNGKGGTYSNSYMYLDPRMGSMVVDLPDDLVERVKDVLKDAHEYKTGSIVL